VALPVTMANPLGQWLHADTRFHLKDLHIAIVAILVALGSAIGMQIMVNSFSHTLNLHLEKQLSADIYLRSDKLNNDLRQTLSNLEEVEQLSIHLKSDGKVNNVPARLASFGESFEHYQHISLTSGSLISHANFTEQGCLANEQSKIKFALSLGDVVEFEQNLVRFSCRITGFVYDYGNPSMLLLTLEKRHKLAELNRENVGFTIRLIKSATVAKFTERLVNEFKQDSTNIIPNKRFKQHAKALFDNTFMVTKILNGFILTISRYARTTAIIIIMPVTPNAKQHKPFFVWL
jgi:putative ABC transport system permease protein